MWQVVKQFEHAMARYTGAPYTVAVESCSAALFLCCMRSTLPKGESVSIPKVTYPSVPAAIIHAGYQIAFRDEYWQDDGWYELHYEHEHAIDVAIDSAKFIGKGMWQEIYTSPICLSFHHKKALPIGRGGMILCESKEDDEWFRWMKHDGRSEGVGLTEDTLHCVGWNMSFTPEQAARGLTLLSNLPDRVVLPPEPYQDLSKYKFFTEANR